MLADGLRTWSRMLVGDIGQQGSIQHDEPASALARPGFLGVCGGGEGQDRACSATGCRASSAIHTWESVKDVPGRVAFVRITAASQAVGSVAVICLVVVMKWVPTAVRATLGLGQDNWPVQNTLMDFA